MRPRTGLLAAAALAGVFLCAPPAEANIVRGFTNIIVGVFQLPLGVLAGTLKGPPVIGTVAGAVTGTVRTVVMIGSGVVDVAGSGFSLVKSTGPYLLPFLL